LVAGADPHEGQRKDFAERWGLTPEHVYADYREMVEKERPDIVSVCTSARVRAEIVKQVAGARVKAMWVEKPMSISLAEADEMLEACRRNGVVLAVNCARRWNPFFATARDLIDQGELGDVLQVTAYGSCGLSHNGSHLLDTVCYWAGGKVLWVYGEMASDQAAASDDDLQGNGYLAFDNGARAFVRGMNSGAADWEFEVIGTKGAIRSYCNAEEFQWRQKDETKVRRRAVNVVKPYPMPARMEGMGLTIVRDIVRAIETGSKPRCSGEDGLAALEIAIAMRESHRRGGVKVLLPLQDRQLKIRSAETYHDDVPALVRRRQAQAKV
jgi:predicted dehydrogenase